MSLESCSLSTSDVALILENLGVTRGIRQWNKQAVFPAVRAVHSERAGSDSSCVNPSANQPGLQLAKVHAAQSCAHSSLPLAG